ncbi:MAG TPA: hypothetical protein PKA39_01290 [Ignavibacteria bacterium]|nr:hypothetical protein [Ignavibacteria bacterium]
MKLTLRVIFFLFFTVLFLEDPAAQTVEKGGKVWGYVFGDYFFKVAGDSTGSSTQYSPYSKSAQGFEIRRAYLGYDYTFNDKFSSQILLEGNDKILTSTRLGLFIKTAFVEWKVFDKVSFAIGLVPTPTFGWALFEKSWYYRPIEKTIMDMRSLGIASDLGVSARGKFDKAGNYGFNVMIGNGNGQKPEINKFKKYYGNLFAKPAKGLQLEIYGDYEPAADEKNKTTLKGHVGYTHEKFNFGVEAFQQMQKNAGGNGIDAAPIGISSYIWGNLLGRENKPILNVFGRYDMYDPDSKNDSAGYKENFITVGLDYMPIENVHFMPNVWINSYSAKNSSMAERKADIAARMTFFFVFK